VIFVYLWKDFFNDKLYKIINYLIFSYLKKIILEENCWKKLKRDSKFDNILQNESKKLNIFSICHQKHLFFIF